MAVFTNKRATWAIYVGRDWHRNRPFNLRIGIGRKPNVPLGEISWRYWLDWSPNFPKLVRVDGRIVGGCIFGRCYRWR